MNGKELLWRYNFMQGTFTTVECSTRCDIGGQHGGQQGPFMPQMVALAQRVIANDPQCNQHIIQSG